MPGARCTRGLVCRMCKKELHTSIQVQRETLRHSLRNGLTAYAALPGDEFVLSPSSAN
jgi:hypothetical protein